MRKIQSDSEFKLPLAHLRLAIGEDRARGLQPFCIIANAGTTNTGAVDALHTNCVAVRQPEVALRR